IEKVHLLAHDYGDTVAQELLARFAERRKKNDPTVLQIESAVLLNGGLFPDVHQPLPIQKALMSPVGILLTPFLSKAKLRDSFQRIFGPDTQATSAEIDAFYELMSRDRGKYIFHKLIRYMAERTQHKARWMTALQGTELPMRLINGSLDPISGKHMADYYEQHIPDADVIHLPTIGHYPQTEAPEQLLPHFFDFHDKLS
ncbi:MAG: alpha/beta hydrolase, partial [Bacteroidota bacterium]